MDNQKIKTAIIGYGRSGGTMHAGAIEKSPVFTLAAVCDIDEKAREEAYKRFSCRVYEDYFKMLESEELDLVVIVTRSSQHSEMAGDCLAAGKNVLVTKPWALNRGEAEKMIAAAKKSGKLLLPWLPARWGADLTRLCELVGSGVIGKIFQVRRSEFTFGKRRDWQTQKEFGGGYLLNWGPHLIDQPIRLLGKPIKSVYADMKQIINPGDAEDMYYAVMKNADGAVIISEFNIGAGDMPNWIIQGDLGTIYVRGGEIEIHRAEFPDELDGASYRNETKITVTKESVSGDRYGDTHEIYAHIAEAVLGGAAYAVSPESALELTLVLDAVRSSSETGEVVYLKF
jgi:predicted dehydrogenase